MKISDSSLTFLDACATIVMYEAADEATVCANMHEIVAALECVLNADYRRVEPYLVEYLLDMQQELLSLGGMGHTENAYHGGSTWPKV